MNLIEFTPALALNHAEMDTTHQEFVDLLNQLAEVPDDQVVRVMDEFIAHTEAHFAQEQQWMEETNFPPLHCHAREHEGVLEIAREVRNKIAAGETHYAPVLAKAVAEWFADHVASMDTILAMYLKQGGASAAQDSLQPACAHANAASCGKARTD